VTGDRTKPEQPSRAAASWSGTAMVQISTGIGGADEGHGLDEMRSPCSSRWRSQRPVRQPSRFAHQHRVIGAGGSASFDERPAPPRSAAPSCAGLSSLVSVRPRADA
jgi:hypothetical protein